MATIFILWSDTDGQTRRIVQVIEEEVRKGGHKLEMVNADAPPRGWIFGKADALLIAASALDGQYTAGLKQMLNAKKARVASAPCALLSVSLEAATPDGQEAAGALVDALIADTGIKPALALSVAGALRYPEYGFFKRLKMKGAAKKLGLPTDTSQVHEFTDWEQVHAFGAQLTELAAGELQPA